MTTERKKEWVELAPKWSTFTTSAQDLWLPMVFEAFRKEITRYTAFRQLGRISSSAPEKVL